MNDNKNLSSQDRVKALLNVNMDKKRKRKFH